MRYELREIIAAHAKLSTPIASLADDADLFAAGMDSLAVVNVMMAIEDRFGLELPDHLLTRRSFASVSALESALRSVQA